MDRLVPEERVFHAGLLVVSGSLLPPSPTENAHPPDRAIATRRTGPPARQRRGLGRRHHDPCASGTGRVVEAEGVVDRVGRHPREVPVDVLDQADARCCVIRRGFSQALATITPVSSTPQMEFLPSPPPVSTVFHRGDEADAHHPEDRRQEALCLTQRQSEDESHRQGGFDRQVGVLKLPTTLADADCRPSGDRTRREPKGDVASVHERSVVLRPISDVVLCLVLWVNS